MSSGRTPQRQSAHDKMIAEAVRVLHEKGYNSIRADHLPSHAQPETISWKGAQSGHIPDLTANGAQASLVLEVETADSIRTTHTQDQWKLFDAFSKQHGKEFWVIVPATAKLEAATQINQMGLSAQIWTM